MTTTTLPSIDWFRDPGLTELTPLTVTTEGRVSGHLCGWGVRHRGLNGYVTPPKSHTGYREFLLHAARVQDGDDVRTVAVGNLTMGTGHAAMNANLRQAVEHYDSSGSVVAQVAVGDDAFGVWYSGAVLPDVDELRLRRFMTCGLSGDWRALGNGGGGLELCAALAVPVPGFSAPRARVASGAQLALVAAGFVSPPARFGKRVADGWSASRPVVDGGVATLDASKLTAGLLKLDDFADAIAARLDVRRAAGELSARHAALVSELDDTPAVVAALLAEVDDSPQRAAELFAELDEGGDFLSGMPPQLKAEWLGGAIAARIAYGTPGQFDRCTAIAREKGVPGHQIDGMCADLIREATGREPGDHG